ncbi:MAG TPA: polysaccharide deacetylase family protein [Candidatus Cloacimonetes bacterium]|nr:polysaccharide deacetylase family protein [Candidatus Cloacimonadota bacterium]
MKVIMFHSVGCDNTAWKRSFLSVPLQQFEAFCRFIHKNMIKAHFLDEWYEAQASGKSHLQGLVLTFDDGYLDNWVYLFPLLQKYQIKATIFVNPGFVDPVPEKRCNLTDVWENRCEEHDLQALGFLNWSEIIEMQKSGWVDIQSHSMSHNWLFSSDKLVDIYARQEKYDWLAWLLHPEQKYQYISNPQFAHKTPLGFPVFENGRALAVRQFIPNTDFIDYAISLYAETAESQADTGAKFEGIVAKLTDFGEKNGFGEYESEEMQKQRYWSELKDSKDILEQKLNKEVRFLCWPGGGYNDLSVALSWDAGYKASTIASWDNHSIIDNKDARKRVKRITLSHSLKIGDKGHYPLKNHFMAMSYRAKSGSAINKWALRAVKAFYLVKGVLGGN